MMRALWTGASGMITQQTNLDTIGNNLSNVNTTGYKKETTQFQTLLYQKIQTKMTDNNGNVKPIIGQVGLGVKAIGVVSQYTQGSLNETGNDYDMAINGDGFFMVRTADGSTGYTRNGNFTLALSSEGVTIANASGYQLLDQNGQPIVFKKEWEPSKVQIDDYGNLMYPDATGKMTMTGTKIGFAQFNNPSGLEKTSGSILLASDASGQPRVEGKDTGIAKSTIRTKFLENSNVETATEIVNLIVAQRAYEMNSKVIQAADEMLQQANNLRK